MLYIGISVSFANSSFDDAAMFAALQLQVDLGNIPSSGNVVLQTRIETLFHETFRKVRPK